MSGISPPFAAKPGKLKFAPTRHLISKAHKPDSAGTQLDYSQLQRACVFAGVSDMDIAGVESIVVALIAQGYMKGYTLPGRGLV